MFKRVVLVGALALSACASVMRYDSVSMLTRIGAYRDLTLATVTSIPGNDHGEWFAPLVGVAKKHGYNVYVEVGLNSMDLQGMTSPREHTILIDASLTGNEKVNVLAHELGHVFQPRTLHWPDSDVFAEAVSFIVCGRLGLDTGMASIGWLRPAEELAKRDIARYGRQIDAAADTIVKEARAGAAQAR